MASSSARARRHCAWWRRTDKASAAGLRGAVELPATAAVADAPAEAAAALAAVGISGGVAAAATVAVPLAVAAGVGYAVSELWDALFD